MNKKIHAAATHVVWLVRLSDGDAAVLSKRRRLLCKRYVYLFSRAALSNECVDLLCERHTVT